MTFPPAPTDRWIAVLFHAPDWQYEKNSYVLADGIQLWSAKDSPAWQLYERLCSDKDLHDSEPFDYGAALVFTPAYSEHTGDFGDPYDTTSVLATLTVVSTGVPIGMLLQIVSFDEFATAAWYHELYNYGGHNEFLLLDAGVLHESSLAHIADAWKHLRASRDLDGRSYRVWNALTHFFYAWTARYSDQRILNLAIVLELLFAPHSQSETTHQIAFNTAWYLGGSHVDRAELYRRIKRLYGVRSTLVHGGRTEEDTLLEAATELMSLCGRLLRLILSDLDRLTQFEVEVQRRAMLDSFLFD